MFEAFGLGCKAQHASQQYLLDSFSLASVTTSGSAVAGCWKAPSFAGIAAAKRTYFYGYRTHVVTTDIGVLVELTFLPGHANNVRGLDVPPFALPPESEVFMDAGYTDYQVEDDAWTADGIRFSVARKGNSARRDTLSEFLFKQLTRHPIETVFSEITNCFPQRIHAVTTSGFLLKATLFVLAFALSKAFI